MLVLYFITFYVATFSGYVYGDYWQCIFEREKECKPLTQSNELPDTVSKLQETCSTAEEHLECFINVLEECGERTNEINLWKKTYEYVKSACDEEGHIFKAVTENIDCIAGSTQQISDNLCYKRFQGMEAIEEFIKPIVEDLLDDEERKRQRSCLLTTFMVTCESQIAGIACGDELGDVAYEFFNNVDHQMKHCKDELKETVRGAFKDALNADEEFVSSIERSSPSSDN